jgi:hypothetical protein
MLVNQRVTMANVITDQKKSQQSQAENQPMSLSRKYRNGWAYHLPVVDAFTYWLFNVF